ncbi:MAG: nucleotidyltransferase domain-containing protein [Ilumatobacteraceae bacterium]
MRDIAARLATIPGVVAVTLGGSRATSTHRTDSDWDFGLYYRGTIDPDDVRALGWAGQVFAPGEWGRLVNGGAWLQVDGQAVDILYRDLDEVQRWTHEAEAGRFEIQREVGYVAGIATYVLAGELALNEVLHGDLPRPAFPEPLRRTAPDLWFRLAAGALAVGQVHARRGDAIAAVANLTQAVLATAQGRLAARGEWALNEKRIVARAGLDEAQALLRHVDVDGVAWALTRFLDLPAWRSSAGRGEG